VTTRRGGVALWREANAASSVVGVVLSSQPSLLNVPATKARTSVVTSNATTPVCAGCTVTMLVAGSIQGLGAVVIDQRAAPVQSCTGLFVFESIAQFQVAPASVHALVRRCAEVVRMRPVRRCRSLVSVISRRAEVM